MAMIPILLLFLVLILPVPGVAVTLSWTDTSDNVDGYVLYRAPLVIGAFAKIGKTSEDVTTFLDPEEVTTVCYRVTGFNAAGESEPSNIVCLMILPANGSISLVIVNP